MRVALLALLALAGCSTAPKRVEIPVPVPCIKALPAKPIIYTDAELAKMPEGAFVDAIWLDRSSLMRAVSARDALLAACSRLSPP
ncbi:MAG: hypothetical protein RL299_932 [Pseudomonadota bacterium]|jgi:hypothetical protein